MTKRAQEGESAMKLAAVWSDDCQGKKDYDGVIIEISTRYWPSGGGFHILDTAKGTFEQSSDPKIKPSASCGLYIRHGDPEGGGDRIELKKQAFEGASFEEIAPQVEEWAQAQMDRVVALLKKEFKKP